MRKSNVWVYDPIYESRHVEIEYRCNACGKLVYCHLYDKAAKNWCDVIGNYKQDGLVERGNHAEIH